MKLLDSLYSTVLQHRAELARRRLGFVRFLLPAHVRYRIYDHFTVRLVEKLPSREFLRTTITSALAAARVERLLFVGTGAFNRQFYEQCRRKGIDVTTIDMDPRASKWGVPGRHIVGDVMELRRIDGELAFDAAILNGVFGFGIDRDDASRALRVVAAALNPNGILVVGWNRGLTDDFCALAEVRQFLIPIDLEGVSTRTEFPAVPPAQPWPHIYDICRVRSGALGWIR